MKVAAWLLLSGGLWASVRGDPVVLQSIRWQEVADSLEIDFDFAFGRPAKYRVNASPDSVRDRNLLLEFSNALPGDAPRLKPPKWAQISGGSSAGVLAVRIQLDKPTPWKADWDGNTLRMHILNRVKGAPVWKNPWVYGGLGSAIIGGGVVFWLLGTEHGKSPPGEGIIPPPDAVFPQ